MISIIILNYKKKRLIKNVVQWLKEADLQIAHEIIVVDNNSQDDSEDFLKQYHPEIKYIQTGKNLGMGGGNNIGIREAQGDYVLIMNPDIFVLSQAIEKLYNYIKENKQVGLVAPQLLNPDRTIQYTCYRWHKIFTPLYRRTFLGRTVFGKKDLAKFLMTDWEHNETREVDWIQGSCWLVRREVFEKLGAFDERYFMYFEDTDFCRRLWENNFKVVYLPEAKMIHLHRRESADVSGLKALVNPLTRTHIKSWMKYLRKHGLRPCHPERSRGI